MWWSWAMLPAGAQEPADFEKYCKSVDRGEVVLVDDDGDTSTHSSIQEAFECAPQTATIVVCPGTYVERVYLSNWNHPVDLLSVVAPFGPEDTVLQTPDDSSQAMVVQHLCDTPVNVVVSGLSIVGAAASKVEHTTGVDISGEIGCDPMTVALRDVRISGHGTGVSIETGAISILDSWVFANTDTGIDTLTSRPLDLTGSWIFSNFGEYGGGLTNRLWGDATILGGTFEGNTAWFGGGLWLGIGTTTLVGTEVVGNVASGTGGGIAMSGGILQDVLVRDNEAWEGGGVSGGTVVLAGKTEITGNVATSHGGGLRIRGGLSGTGEQPIRGNHAPIGGGLWLGTATSDDPWLVDASGLWIEGNTADEGGGVYVDSPGTLTALYVSGNDAIRGGGVFEHNVAMLAIDESSISGNTAIDGAGLYLDGAGKLDAGSTHFSGNVALGVGGGLWIGDQGSVSLAGGTVRANQARIGGGAAILATDFWLDSDGVDWGSWPFDNAQDDLDINGVSWPGGSDPFACDSWGCGPWTPPVLGP